jgi:hypothetical protein
MYINSKISTNRTNFYIFNIFIRFLIFHKFYHFALFRAQTAIAYNKKCLNFLSIIQFFILIIKLNSFLTEIYCIIIKCFIKFNLSYFHTTISKHMSLILLINFIYSISSFIKIYCFFCRSIL